MQTPQTVPPLVFRPADPATQADLQKAAEQEAPAAPRIDLQPAGEFDTALPSQEMMSNGFVDAELMQVTDDEKAAYLKAMLPDELFRLTLKFFNGSVDVAVRARYVNEQVRIKDLLDLEIKQGTINQNDPAFFSVYATRMQFFNIAVMVERINGKLFSELRLAAPGVTLETDLAVIQAFVRDKVEPLPVPQHTLLHNALRVFESKCAKLATEAANESFWKPRS